MARPAPAPTTSRTPLRLAAVVLAALVGLVGVAPSASAETAYRYWSYFTGEGTTWTAAMTGPADVVPAEGSVQAMRFAVHGTAAREPRTAPDFAAVCAGTEPSPEGARVAVLVDPGVAEDAPEGGAGPGGPTATCVLAAPGDTAKDVIAAVAELREGDGGLVCAVGGYPATGCGDEAPGTDRAADAPVQFQVTSPVGFPEGAGTGAAPADPAPAEDQGSRLPAIAVTVVALLLVAGAVVVASRRRRG